MGKRRSERPAGGDGKFRAPKPKQSPRGSPAEPAGDGADATGSAGSGDADGEPKPAGQTTGGSTGMSAPGGGDGEGAAPELSQAGERSPSPSPQEGGAPGAGGGGESPAAAAPIASQPESPRRADSVAADAGKDEAMAPAERHGSAGEELDAETPAHGRMGDSGSCERGSSPAAGGGGAAGAEIALLVDPPDQSDGVSAEGPNARRAERVNPSEPQDATHQSREAVVNTEGNKSGAATGGEHRQDGSGERPQAGGMSDAAESVEVPGVCASSADPAAEGGAPEPESTGGNDSPRKTPGEAAAGRKEAGGGEIPDAATSALDSSIVAGADPSGEREGEDPAEEHPDAPSLAPSGGGTAPSAPTTAATPEPPRNASMASAVSAEPGKSLEQPLPDADQRDPAAPTCGEEVPAPPQGRIWCVGVTATARQTLLRSENCADFGEYNHSFLRGEAPCAASGGEDATDIVCGLILELSNLNRLAMSAHRGLEALRRAKPRRSRRPGAGTAPPRAGRRWKET